jgi:hypothetical protein
VSTERKPASELKLHDEFDAYSGTHLRRVSINRVPEIQGDRVLLSVRPASFFGKATKVWFRSDALVEVYLTREARLSKAEQDRKRVLDVFGGVPYSQSPYEIQGQVCGEMSLSRVRIVLCDLARHGELIRKRRGRGNCTFYRPPLAIGTSVIDTSGTRAGVVIERKLLRTENKPYPVVQWMDGSKSFGSEQGLEPMEPGKGLRLKSLIKKTPPLLVRQFGQQDIPLDLIYRANECKGRARARAFVEIAEWIGAYSNCRGGVLMDCDHAALLDYLDYCLPGWRNMHQRQVAA